MTLSPLAQQLIASPLSALLSMLQENVSFFALSRSDRASYTDSLSQALRDYLLSGSEEDFMMDMQSLFSTKGSDNALSSALMTDLSTDLLALYDTFPEDFGLWASAKKEKHLATMAANNYHSVILHYSQQEVEQAVAAVLQQFAPAIDIIVVEAPRSVSAELKQQIRSHYQPNLVFFHANQNLLGGMRVLQNGKLLDYSWSGKVQQWALLLN